MENKTMIFLGVMMLLMIGTTIYAFEKAEKVNGVIYRENDNIDWIYDCSGQFINQHYNCPNPLQNLTGKYCGEELLCQNEYKLKEESYALV